METETTDISVAQKKIKGTKVMNLHYWVVFHIFLGEMQRQRGLRKLLGGFKFQIFFYVHPYLGEMIQCDSYFSDGLKPSTRLNLAGG